MGALELAMREGRDTRGASRLESDEASCFMRTTLSLWAWLKCGSASHRLDVDNGPPVHPSESEVSLTQETRELARHHPRIGAVTSRRKKVAREMMNSSTRNDVLFNSDISASALVNHLFQNTNDCEHVRAIGKKAKYERQNTP
jgi:hypothetical protein